ncbi:hypothetical protein K788_0008146 [Paraburkholderia caribensis MBA4]|uniref:Uncharacterized protein n=1 Tax=Paraburkholderia caribensis MBA4 TaxID=1323664 RepID=A0A0P0RGA9_9BURK|nr:hypothetical protein K788_0008146 [Paraburkholderia caribensis MBA4]
MVALMRAAGHVSPLRASSICDILHAHGVGHANGSMEEQCEFS